MAYIREVQNLSQTQAIENLRAVLNSDYFKSYEFAPNGSRLSADMITITSLGHWRRGAYTVGDLSDAIHPVLETIERKGTLNDSFIALTPSEQRLRLMNFEEKLYEEDLDLPLGFEVTRVASDVAKYRFRITNLGFKESYFESQGLDLKDANQKLSIWYRELTRSLKKILPHQVQAPAFS